MARAGVWVGPTALIGLLAAEMIYALAMAKTATYQAVELTPKQVSVSLFGEYLGLRLQRTYVFLTLASAVAVVFDVASLRFADELPRVQIYGELFMALIFPLAVWDIFEEIAGAVAALPEWRCCERWPV